MRAPKWLVDVLTRVLPPERHDDLIGDLEELHARRTAQWGNGVAWMVTLTDATLMVLAEGARRAWRSLTGAGRLASAVEIRLALRLVRKQPVMTLTAVVALGTGIGIVAGGFSVFHQGLYGELPFPNGDRWVWVESFDEATGGRTPLELERVRRFRAAASSLAYLAGTETGDYNVVHANGEVERILGARITPGTFRHLPYRPTLGRLLTAEDGAPGAPPVALIRESLWARRFSRDSAVIGQRVTVAGADHVIVGVLPDDAGYPDEGEL